ncbi:MBL fold metallo-hydrolase [Siminovitchia acidinfaciens]|uniref:MBL fold metallo-hydrolase n=1 Tax=Siminovitchia acidinfaciens TaxID=2321395 RepID=A0A429XYD4_9BACI|nr:MBL fold metallo-hydrolase [Siminovitchia acidinfaciens]RST73750.1 MBL fold metallo-hydrolase [Siminovitchia acidinfaciens]
MDEKIFKLVLPTPFAVGDVNVYLVKGDTLTLIDAGVKTEEAWDAFQKQLKEIGFEPRDIEQVVLTHHHPDHVGLLELMPEEIPVYGHPYVRPWLEKDKSFFEGYDQFYSQLFTEFGMEGDFERMLAALKAPLRFSAKRALTYEIEEGDVVPGLENWTVFETPGHAQSHLAFYREEDGVLIAGDHILATISSNPLLEPSIHPGNKRPKPQLQYNESLRKMLDVDISKVYTGHGAEVKKAHELIERRLTRQHDRAMQVREILKEQPVTTFELTKILFPAVYEKQLGLTLSETTAQLDYLLENELVTKKINDNGTAYFSA